MCAHTGCPHTRLASSNPRPVPDPCAGSRLKYRPISLATVSIAISSVVPMW
jgi:hypothetical protein